MSHQLYFPVDFSVCVHVHVFMSASVLVSTPVCVAVWVTVCLCVNICNLAGVQVVFLCVSVSAVMAANSPINSLLYL